jgi:hypothetical protein
LGHIYLIILPIPGFCKPKLLLNLSSCYIIHNENGKPITWIVTDLSWEWLAYHVNRYRFIMRMIGLSRESLQIYHENDWPIMWIVTDLSWEWLAYHVNRYRFIMRMIGLSRESLQIYHENDWPIMWIVTDLSWE